MPFATTLNGRISYTIVGPTEPSQDPQTLLMIMGLAGSGAMWSRLLPHISRHNRAIVFDNRGTGDSSPARPPLTMRTLTNDAVAVLDAAGIERAHVMGASMGGMIAQHLALDHRARVLSLILACTTAGGRREPPNLRLTAASLLRPWIGPARTFALVAPVLYSSHTLAGASARLQEDRRVRASDRVRALTPLLQASAVRRHDTRPRLHELAGLPTLVIHGLEDRLVTPAHGRELADAIPGAQLVEIPDAGHLLATDAEETVANAIVSHLETAARPNRPDGSRT
ncbi:MAG TPA: alpha/beta fold hydrolase [Solirubrobacteraceae bacterium]|nr:alpha/beta fold hydrolase [Solirubrobacteraceae bacterium]